MMHNDARGRSQAENNLMRIFVGEIMSKYVPFLIVCAFLATACGAVTQHDPADHAQLERGSGVHAEERGAVSKNGKGTAEKKDQK
jgi:hypothetical protein